MYASNEISFGDCTLRRDSGDLIRGGRTVRLRTQVQQVLEALLERPGEVVTREELVAKLWPKGVVDYETALNSAVRRLRAALDDDANAPRHIETLPRRGYRFIGIVRPDAADAPDSPARNGSYLRALRALVASGFCIAVAGSTHLHHLIDTPSDPPRSVSAGSSRMEARSEYGLARYFLDRRRAGDLDRARIRFERAIALDSNDASAYAGLASVYWLLVVQSEMTRERGLPRVRAAAERALALDGRNAEAHIRMSRYAESIGDAAGGKEHARIAWREGPEDPTVLSDEASVALAEGRLEDAVDFSRRAAVAAPVSVALRYNLAFALFVTGRYDEAREINLSLADVDVNYSTDIAAQALIMQKRFDEALALASTWPQGAGRQEIEALAYRGLNRNAEANLALDKMIEGFRDSDPLRIVEVYAYRGDSDRAFEWLTRGTDWISSGRLPGPFGGMMPWALRLSPFVASLRSDPRWIKWTAKRAAPETNKNLGSG